MLENATPQVSIRSWIRAGAPPRPKRELCASRGGVRESDKAAVGLLRPLRRLPEEQVWTDRGGRTRLSISTVRYSAVSARLRCRASVCARRRSSSKDLIVSTAT